MTTTRPVRWGILGTGGITAKLLAGAAASPDAEVVAVGSRDTARATAFAAANGIPRAHGSYDDLLEDPGVEAVYISLPNALHHPWTMRSLAAGKHVLCEKPYSRHPDEVEAAFDLAERASLVLSEAFMWRHHAQADRIVELLPELGRLQLIRASFSWRLTDPADVRLRADLDGGSLMDVGCYAASGSRMLAGEEPDVVFGMGVPGPTGVDLRFAGVLHFPSGTLAEISSGFTSDFRSLEAVGTDGSAELVDPWHATPAVVVRDRTASPLDDADPYRLEVEDVGAAIRGTRTARLGRVDALGQARTIDALLRSAESGAPVRL